MTVFLIFQAASGFCKGFSLKTVFKLPNLIDPHNKETP